MGHYLSAALSYVNSAALHHAISASLSNLRVRTVEEVRRVRLAELVDEFGSYAQLNELTGRRRNDSTLSQYANTSPNSKGGAPKGMGSEAARGLEGACKKPTGWMDTDPDLWPFPEDLPPERIRALKPGQIEAFVLGVRVAIAAAEATVPAPPAEAEDNLKSGSRKQSLSRKAA